MQANVSDYSSRLSQDVLSFAAEKLAKPVEQFNLKPAIERLFIRNKAKEVQQLTPNAAQIEFLSRALGVAGQKKLLILKARQLGMSTLIQAIIYALARYEALNAITISHEAEATQRLHEKARFFLERDKSRPPTRYNRLGAVEFADTRATHYIGTAGARTFGRGDTLHFAHCSEFAFWPKPETLLPGLLEALTKDAWIVLETTPNGVGGMFYDLWQNAPFNGWLPLFFPWWWDSEYKLALLEPNELEPYSDEEKTLIRREGLSAEQIKWRRDKIRSNPMFKQEYPEDAESCFLSSGRPYFTPEALKLQEKNIGEPIRTDGKGLSIWREFDGTHIYVVAGDPAEGLEGGDWSVGQVLDLTAQEQVATLRGLWPTDHFGKGLCMLASQYGTALLGIERNNHGHAVLNTALNGVGYSNIYYHEEYDPRQSGERIIKKPGWPTTEVSKPVMLSDMEAAFTDVAVTIHDSITLQEFRTMHWNGKGGVGAIAGCHDDAAMAFMIAWQLRKYPRAFSTAMGYFDAIAKQREAVPEPLPR